MITPTKEEWDSFSISDEKSKFFVQRWDELHNDSVYESWQVRSTNINSILDEIIESSQIVKAIPSHKQNLADLIQEMKQIKSDDIILKKYYKSLNPYFEKIDKCFSMKNEINDYNQIIQICTFCKPPLDSYLDNIFTEIDRIIKPDNVQYKIDLNQILMLLAIELKNRGYSRKYIIEANDIFKSSKDFKDKYEEFRERFAKEKEHYVCYFMIRSSVNFNEIKNKDIAQITRSELPDIEVVKNFIEQSKEDIILKIETNAYDYISASNNARSKILNLFAMRSLYQPSKSDVKMHPLNLVNNGEYKINKKNQKSQSYINDSNSPDENLARLVELFNKISFDDINYLQASVQYLKLSLISENIEARIINLWIALETLFQEEDGSIIGRISDFLPTIISSSYINSILRSLSKDLKHYWMNSRDEELKKYTKKSNNKFLNPYDLNRILLLDDSNDIYLRFEKMIDSDALLKFRVGNIKTGIYHSSKEMKKRITRHNKNINWQLRRIYRIRNKITHRGTVEVELNQFYIHLYSYYTNTIHRIIQVLVNNPSWNITTALQFLKNNYYFFLEALENNDDLNARMIYKSSIHEKSSDEACN